MSFPTVARRRDGTTARRYAIRALVAVVACAAGLAGPAAAYADPAQDEGIPVSVAPSAAPGTPIRVGFELTADPGAVLRDEVTITNLSAEPQVFLVYPADGFNTPEGRFDVRTPATPSTDVGSWVKLARPAVTLAGRASTTVAFTVTVPPGAAPGDHVGGIVAAGSGSLPNQAGGSVQVTRRAGARIYLRVGGPTRTSLDYRITGVRYAGGLNPFGGKATVTYTVHNTGNTVVAGEQRLSARGLVQGATRTDPLPVILPGAEVTLTAVVDGVRPFGRVSVRGELVPERSPTDATQVAAAQSREQAVWATSWLLVLLVLAVLAGAAYWLVRRRRRSRPEPDAAEREPALL